MLILTFEEFNNKFNIDNNAMSDIRIKDIGKDISLTPIEIVMRDDKPEMVSEPNFNIIVNLHPTEGTHWVLVIRREGGPVYSFDSFGVETPPLFLEEYVDLGSDETIQQYDESYCGAYCLYMIYLIDRGFRINSTLNILVNQCKYPGMYNECFCLGCSNDKVDDNVNDNVNQGTCFADDNVNDNVNDNVKIMIMIMLMIMIMIKIMIYEAVQQSCFANSPIYEVVIICKAGFLISEPVSPIRWIYHPREIIILLLSV